MNNRRFWLSGLVASAVLGLGGYLWYSVLLRNFYRDQAGLGVLRRRSHLSGIILSRLIYGFLLTWLYPKLRNGKRRAPDSITVGVAAGALQSVPAGLVQWANTRVGWMGALASFLFETALGGLTGFLVGWIHGNGPKLRWRRQLLNNGAPIDIPEPLIGRL